MNYFLEVLESIKAPWVRGAIKKYKRTQITLFVWIDIFDREYDSRGPRHMKALGLSNFVTNKMPKTGKNMIPHDPQ